MWPLSLDHKSIRVRVSRGKHGSDPQLRGMHGRRAGGTDLPSSDISLTSAGAR